MNNLNLHRRSFVPLSSFLNSHKVGLNSRFCSSSSLVSSDNDDKKVSTGISANVVKARALLEKRRNLRFMFPEFLPDPELKFRNKLAEKLYRNDLLSRRENVELPEFYVGSILAVTTADPNGIENKSSRFLGIVIDRGGSGLSAWILLRNFIDGQGIEILYHIYNPTVLKIEVIRNETRLDNELYYLRDADPKYSTYPQDMDPEILPEESSVPLNDIVIKLRPKPWSRNWERYIDRLHGFDISQVMDENTKKKLHRFRAKMNIGSIIMIEKYDLLKQYLETIPIEQQDEIWAEVAEDLERRDKAMRKVASQKAFSRPQKMG